ncbi:hypothetical protein BGZ92_011562 [Podila epicladia]|nr:hypothetical protein BGZ92_011562 [Podila epicladia]
MTGNHTIKAALYEGIKSSSPYLVPTEIPTPVAQHGDVVFKVLASRVVDYFKDMVTGNRFFPSIVPMVPGPGGIGIIKSVGPSLVHLKLGQMVFIDPVVHARDHPTAPLAMMQDFIGFDEGGQKLQQVWRHGSWAEETMVPAENVTVIPPSLQQNYKPEQLIALTNHTVAHGGFMDAGLQAGQTVAITGSTGTFGASAVAVALAMGARRVIAAGRTRKQLDEYVKIHGPRVVPLVSTGDEDKDMEAFVQAAGEGFVIDLVLDILPPVASFGIVRSAIRAMRANGIQSNIELPYQYIVLNNITIKGKFMYHRADPTMLIGVVDAGLLRLDADEYKAIKLEEINEAIDWTADNSVAQRGVIVINLLASRIVDYFKDMVTGNRFFPSVVPMVPGPGGIGIIKSVGAGLVHLKPGQMVFIDPVVHARDHPTAPLAMMQDSIGFDEGGQKLQ